VISINTPLSSGANVRPIREGLMQMDPPRLLGSVCGACMVTMFPPRDFCPACASDAVPECVALPEAGTLYSYTVVRQAPPGRVTPYVLAYVDLPGGVRVLAQIDMDPGQIEIGTPVKLELRPIDMDGDQTLIGYVFVRQEELYSPLRMNQTGSE